MFGATYLSNPGRNSENPNILYFGSYIIVNFHSCFGMQVSYKLGNLILQVSLYISRCDFSDINDQSPFSNI